jgi:hypothetical protein
MSHADAVVELVEQAASAMTKVLMHKKPDAANSTSGAGLDVIDGNSAASEIDRHSANQRRDVGF